jgi:hypothetical protein
MMDHMGNKVVFIGTDFVMRTAKSPRRSTDYSSKTEATANVSLSTVSTDITNKCIDSKEKEEEETSKLLIRKIAKEMLESLQKNGSLITSGASKPSDEISTKPSDSSARDTELAALSDMILSSFEAETKHAGGSDKHLRKMLREGLEENECSTQASSVKSSANSKTNSTRSTSTESGLSGLSMNESSGYKAPMDIWHPNFWDVEAEEDVGSNAADEVGGEIAGSTLDSLEGEKAISIESSDEDDEDDSSVWSDITGLTGAFADFPEGRRSSKNEVPATIGLHSIVASKDKVKTKNPVVSYSLRFDKVVVRNYDRILTDNPACTTGPSVGLGWEYVEEDFDIEDYEMDRGRLRRTNELLLNRAQREKLVRDLGYTERDIAAAVRGGNKIKSRRRQTINNLGAYKMEEAVENAGKRVKRMLLLRNF